jgi:hypothetical protein
VGLYIRTLIRFHGVVLNSLRTGTTFPFIGSGGIHWIELALDMDQWRTFVNTVMKLRVS